MIFQDALTQRIFIVLLVQVWPIFQCSFIAYKLLKRAKNRTTFTISSFFITLAITYFFATISIFFINTPLSYIFYIIGIYYFFYSHSFFIVISWVLINLEKKSSSWKYYAAFAFYRLLATYIFWIGYYFNGITLDSSTNWVPTYSWSFLILSWSLLLVFLLIPQIYFTFKLRKVFEGVVLRRRINLFIISVFLELPVVFGLFLYNTLVENLIFRTIFILITPAASTIAAFLIYRSFGKELE